MPYPGLVQIADIRDDYEAARDWEVRVRSQLTCTTLSAKTGLMTAYV